MIIINYVFLSLFFVPIILFIIYFLVLLVLLYFFIIFIIFITSGKDWRSRALQSLECILFNLVGKNAV